MAGGQIRLRIGLHQGRHNLLVCISYSIVCAAGGLTWAHARLYDAIQRRLLSCDPLGGGMRAPMRQNRSAYALGHLGEDMKHWQASNALGEGEGDTADMIETIALTLSALLVCGELIWYVWLLRARGWTLLHRQRLPAVGLLCGVLVLAAVAVDAAVAWTQGPDAATRLARGSPILLILLSHQIFVAAIVILSGRYDTAEVIAIRDAVAETIRSHPGWIALGFIIGMVSVPPMLLRPLLPGVSYLIVLIGTGLLSLIEVMIALLWLVRRFSLRGDGLVPLVRHVPAIAWGGIGGYAGVAAVYYLVATLFHPAWPR